MTAVSGQIPQPVAVPRLLVELPWWPRVFFGNLRDLVFPRRLPALEIRSAPAAFWPDVFVKHRLPWYCFFESGVCHLIAFVLLVGFTRFFALQPHPAPRPTFDHTQVIYYEPAEYLPPLDTRSPHAAQPRKADPNSADPEFSRQPIISVPPEADNRAQTIVTPPNVKLKHDVALPNIVAWSDRMSDRIVTPRLAIPAAPLVPAAEITRLAPQMQNSVVTPPPDAARLSRRRDQPNLQTSVVAPPPDLRTSNAATAFEAPQPAVIAPPPSLEIASTRALGELNMGHSSVIAPAPQLPVGEQRAVPGGRSSPALRVAPQVVPPPPSFASGRSGESLGESFGTQGRVIALNLHPAVGAPADPPPGNRRGAFAATPEGHAGASGSPGSSAGNAAAGTDGHGDGSSNENGSRSNRKGTSDLPVGLYVGNPAAAAKTSPVAGDPAAKAAAADPVDPNIVATVRMPHATSVPARALQPESAANLFEVERAVFGGRRFYSLTLNLPNLNSAGGSWVIRFTELKQDPNSPAGDLSQPTVIHKVDPAYPMQLMRENVGGTVILYAVIHADGTVGNVRVLRSVDDRLDRFAVQAVSKWQFQPATKNGSPVDVEATFQIPFRPARVGTNF